jgi:endonuclease/exonuclease/phosphatase family metal-dependent hydrolase
MRRIILTVTLCLVAIAIGAQSLYVASYNIRYHNNEDVKKGNGWNRRCPVVCSQINFEHPDIFGAQEVLKPQLDDMTQLLADYDHIGIGREDGVHKGEHEAIFYDRKKIELLDHGDFWLSETPEKPSLGWDAACIRICTWGRFREKLSNTEFFFFNLHMDHVGVVARREAAKLVVERIGQIAKDAPVVLTGDFNVDQHDEIYTIFTGSPLLKDSYEHALQRFAENGTFNDYKPDLKTDSRIDHVFVSPSFVVEHYGILTNCYWTEEGRRLPSDHYPVFVKLNKQH